MKIIASLIIGLVILTSFKVRAQSCNGNFGDPVIKIDFGSGTATHGPELGSAFTSYTFTTGVPGDGSYTIINSTANTNSGWYAVTDHTGNAGGYMMLVNASTDPGIFYQTPVKGLCAGTTYEFSAYVINLLNYSGIKPNITFSIETTDGKQLATPYNTGDIAEGGGWIKYPLTFTSTTDQVVVKMTNNGPGGIGNDIAIDDITFRPCGPVITTSFSSTQTQTIQNSCSGVSQSYTLTANLPAGYDIQWQANSGTGWSDIPGAQTTTYQVNFPANATGTYQYRLASANPGSLPSLNCRTVSNVLTLTINTSPAATVTANSPVCEGDALNLAASAGATYNWTGPNGFSSSLQSPVINAVTPAAAGTYNVKVISAANCETDASVNVTVNPKPVATATVDQATICEGSTAQLNASGGVSYTWSPVTGLSNPSIANPVASPTDNTTYTVTALSTAGCTSTAQVTVNVLKKPGANAGADKKMTQGQSVTLNGVPSGTDVNYFWTPTDYLSDPNSLTPVATPPADITYTLHVVSKDGCTPDATDDVFVRVYKKVVVPNTFTPNNDGTNDIWDVVALDTYPESTTQVYNRYGSLVYQSTGYARAWDGKRDGAYLPGGTYYYIIDLKNGTILKGWVLLVR